MSASQYSNASASLLKAMQFFKMAGAYFEDVKRDSSASEYRKYSFDKITRSVRDIFNELNGKLSKEQAQRLQSDLDDSATLDSIFTNAALLTPASREELERFALQLIAKETANAPGFFDNPLVPRRLTGYESDQIKGLGNDEKERLLNGSW